jgi:hypothetical protein
MTHTIQVREKKGNDGCRFKKQHDDSDEKDTPETFSVDVIFNIRRYRGRHVTEKLPGQAFQQGVGVPP